jgi:bile acid-coenzyme A ligase
VLHNRFSINDEETTMTSAPSSPATVESGTEVLPIGAQLSALAAQDPDAPAITADGVTVTRAQLDSASNRLARAYADLGVKQGDYVTIVLPNGIEFFQAAIAAWKLGATVAPLSARIPENELRAILPLVPRALLVGRSDPDGVIPDVPAGFQPPAALSEASLPPVVSPIWKVMPSGGSTGRPKLIAATQDSRIDPRMMGMALGLSGDTQLMTGPLSYNTPLVTAVTGLQLGQHVIVMSRFDAAEALRLISEYHVDFMSTVPTVLQRMLPVYRQDPDRYDVSSLKRLWHAAAVCPPELKQAWIDILGAENVWELYGGSESTAITVINGVDWQTHRGSVGRVALGQMKVLDDDGAEVAPRTVGQIFQRTGDGTPPSYRYIGSETVLHDGWETIGDMGWFDEDGFLYISDRRVDMFNVGGRKVYPAEVESALSDHSGVLSCLVVGVPDDDLGQVGYALVEADPAANLDEATILAFLSAELPGYKVPHYVEFRDEPLRDDMAKARRSAVRDDVIRRMEVSR